MEMLVGRMRIYKGSVFENINTLKRSEMECRVMGFVSEFLYEKNLEVTESGTQVQYKLTMPGKGTHLRLYS